MDQGLADKNSRSPDIEQLRQKDTAQAAPQNFVRQIGQVNRTHKMTASEITQMISTDTFTAEFSAAQRERIKKLWLEGKIREAQQEAQQILEPPKRTDRTLL